MTALNTDDLAVVTGPLSLEGELGCVFLEEGEVVRIIESPTEDPRTSYVRGLSSDISQYIDTSSLTPLSEIQDLPDVKWGDLLDPDYVHDYVWEGE